MRALRKHRRLSASAWAAQRLGTLNSQNPLPALTSKPSSAQRRCFFFSQKPRGCLLGIDGLSTPADFPRLAEEAVETSRQHINGISEKRPGGVVSDLDAVSNDLCRIADAAELCRNVHPSEEYVTSASEAVTLVQNFMSEANLDSALYESMLKAEGSDELTKSSPEARAVLRHMRVSMEMEGIHLPPTEKATCLNLLEREQDIAFAIIQRQEKLRQGQEGEGIWLPLKGLAEMPMLQQHASREWRRHGSSSDEVCLPFDPPLLEQVLATSRCSQTRRTCHEALEQPDPEGDAAVVELMHVRQSLAEVRGFQTWNHYSQRESLVGNPENVKQFLAATWQSVRPGVEADLKSLAEAKERFGLGQRSLDPWDVPLLRNLSTMECAGSEAIKEYLGFPALMKAVSLILDKMFQLKMVPEDVAPGEVWHESVLKFTLRPQDNSVAGILYIDAFQRDGKTVRSAQFTVQGSRLLPEGDKQVPVAALVFSMPAMSEGMPVNSAVTFMHEIGHALHSVLSDTHFQHLSGTRGTVDFVEFPSHLFEHYVLDSDCMPMYASHFKTGTSLPTDVKAAHDWRKGHLSHIEVLDQLMYSTMDQAFYSYTPAQYESWQNGVSPAVIQDVHSSLSEAFSRFDSGVDAPINAPLSQILRLPRASRFDHLVHYGGSYYCYIFNRALSAHVWQEAFKADPLSEECGRRLRNFFAQGSVTSDISVIQNLCPGSSPFTAADIPLDALLAQLKPHAP
eukprot:3957193-Amphidinium_carterae.1